MSCFFIFVLFFLPLNYLSFAWLMCNVPERGLATCTFWWQWLSAQFGPSSIRWLNVTLALPLITTCVELKQAKMFPPHCVD